ncbi:MAG: hypothetical protein AAFP76_00065 [Bacteroidota bacterium]
MRGAYLILFVLAIFATGCQQKSFDTKEELLSYISDPENGYLQKKQVNGVEISLMYRPVDLTVIQELEGVSTKASIDSLRAFYQENVYFNLSLSKNGRELLSAVPSNRHEFGAMVNQLSFGMDQKIHLYNKNKDTINMKDYVYPRMYGMTHATSMLLVFPRDEVVKDNGELTLSIEDIGVKTGEVKFKMSVRKIKDEPMLQFDI